MNNRDHMNKWFRNREPDVEWPDGTVTKGNLTATPVAVAHAVFKGQILDKGGVLPIERIPVEIVAKRNAKSEPYFFAVDPSTRIEYRDSKRKTIAEVSVEMTLRFKSCVEDWQPGGYYSKRKPQEEAA